MRLTLHTFLTLDGVMQAPGGPDEDRVGGFAHGGWTFPYADETFGAAIAGRFVEAGAFLLGRRTYEIFAAYWPGVTEPGHPIAGPLNALPKYVASRTLTSVDWPGSVLLGGDVVAEVRALKAQPGGELQVHGSGNLVQTLIDNDLIDEYRLLWFPVHLGGGKRLFGDGRIPRALRLTGVRESATGVVMTTYEPDGPVRLGSFTDADADRDIESGDERQPTRE
jgi:dihydrofolate reductase